MSDKSKSLITLSNEANQLAAKLIELDGELDDDLEQELALSEKNLASKADNYRLIINTLESKAEQFRRYKQEFAMAEKSALRNMDALKQRLKDAMETMHVRELKGTLFRAKLQNSKPKVMISDESKLPAKYCREKTTIEPDKDAINKALLEGTQVEGCILAESKHIRFYTAK